MALDIGTEAVKALVFEKVGKQYFILGSALQYFDESRPFDDDKIMLGTVDEALGRAGRSPKELLLGFSPNVLKSRVITFEFSRQKPEAIISAKEAKSIIELSSQEIQKKIAKHFTQSSGILPQDIQFTDDEILEIKIDGYEVPNLSGYSGKKIGLKVMASFLPKGCIEKHDRIFNPLGFKRQIINPAVNLGTAWQDDAIFIDVGGNVTQVCLIKKGKIEDIDEFEAGGKDFSMIISQTLGMQPQEARFFKERYSMGELSEDSRGRVKDILSPVFGQWHSLLKLKLGAIKGSLPSAFFLFGGGSQLPGIGEQAEDGKEVKLIYPKDFPNIIDNTHRVNSPQFINSMLLFYAR